MTVLPSMERDTVLKALVILSVVLALAAVVHALTGCGGEVSHTPNPPEAQPQHHIRVPGDMHIPLVADTINIYWTDPTCPGDPVTLGMSAQGATPEYATDGNTWWPVLERYTGANYLMFDGQCVPGGGYEGYDFFTLGEPLARP